MKNNNKAFTLLEIAVVLSLLGVIAVFAIGISNSVQNMTKMTETKKRMNLIAEKARDYYRGHEDLPDPINPGVLNHIPVSQNEFDMEQKYRIDGWGQYFYYNRELNQGAITYDRSGVGPGSFTLLVIGALERTLITGVTVDGKNVAGVLISGGPNQTIEAATIGGDPDFITSGDDILEPIDVSTEAKEIVMADLKSLQSKVNAFDAIYEGIDNNNSGIVDEDYACEQGRSSVGGAHPWDPDNWPVCPPNPDVNATAVDPNVGTFTLDYIKANIYNSGCAIIAGRPWGAITTGWAPWDPFARRSEIRDDCARYFIYSLFSMPVTTMIDPWFNGYIWGCGDSICAHKYYTSADPHYHKFFSAGPDGLVDTDDDIIP